MIYAVSSIPSSKEALLPVSSGASLTGANKNDCVSVVSEPMVLIIE